MRRSSPRSKYVAFAVMAAIGVSLASMLTACASDAVDPTAAFGDDGQAPTAIRLWPSFSRATDSFGYNEEFFAPRTIATLAPDETSQAVATATISVSLGGLHPMYRDETDGVSQRVEWSSSDPSVATIDGHGTITARRQGTTTIRVASVKNREVTASSLVTVLAAPLHLASVDVGNAACGITDARSVYCWGVPINTASSGGEPFDVGPVAKSIPEPVVTISSGGAFYYPYHDLMTSCALVQSGAAYCWGDNAVGQLGDGTTVYRTTPVAVSGGLRFKSIAVGAGYTCGLDLDGKAYCWGAQVDLSHAAASSSVPVAVPGNLRFKSIAAGVQACGIVDDGTAYCWGSSPMPVPGNQKFVQLAVAKDYICGRSPENDVYCWGTSTSGGLGLGAAVTTAAAPTAVPGGIKFSSISVGTNLGGALTCGLAVDGKAYCWGSNGDGQIGAGLPTGADAPNVFSPTLVKQPGSWTAVSAGARHACGVAGEKIYCWGYVFGHRSNTPDVPTLMEGQGR